MTDSRRISLFHVEVDLYKLPFRAFSLTGSFRKCRTWKEVLISCLNICQGAKKFTRKKTSITREEVGWGGKAYHLKCWQK